MKKFYKLFFSILGIAFIFMSFDYAKVKAADATISTNGYMQIPVQGTYRYDYAKQVFDKVNQERANAGVSTLQYDEELTTAAMLRSAEITVSFSHVRPNGSSCFTVIGKANGENIAAGSSNADGTMNQWMNSQGHKENILDSRFKSMGVGCIYVGKGYGWYWVQLFSTQNASKIDSRTNTQNVNTSVEVQWSNFSITSNASNNTLEVGNYATITATGKYNNTTYNIKNNINYTSSDNSIAVIQDGKIKGVKPGNVTITAKIGNKTATYNIKIIPREIRVMYRTHVQNIGWQSYVKNGAMSGTSGKALRLEGINIKLENQPYTGDIEYSTHVENIGWQGFVKNNAMSGTSGRSLRLEAIKIRLTGEMANHYDIYYRVHAENVDWMNWAKNGNPAGTAGYAYRLEAIEIVLVEKEKNPPTRINTVCNKAFKHHLIGYRTHVENIGWQWYVYDGALSGTTGRALRLEGINIKLDNQDYSGDVEYSTHVENIGWQGFVKNNAMAGTSGRALRLEAIKIRLTGEMANHYDIYYRVHAQNFGWMGWAKNGEEAGTAGYAYRLEGINIVLVEKGGQAPGSTANHFSQYVAPVQSYNNYNSSSSARVINTRTGKFHRPTCGALKNANQSNLRTVYESSDSLRSQGYSACKDCKP